MIAKNSKKYTQYKNYFKKYILPYNPLYKRNNSLQENRHPIMWIYKIPHYCLMKSEKVCLSINVICTNGSYLIATKAIIANAITVFKSTRPCGWWKHNCTLTHLTFDTIIIMTFLFEGRFMRWIGSIYSTNLFAISWCIL